MTANRPTIRVGYRSTSRARPVCATRTCSVGPSVTTLPNGFKKRVDNNPQLKGRLTGGAFDGCTVLPTAGTATSFQGLSATGGRSGGVFGNPSGGVGGAASGGDVNSNGGAGQSAGDGRGGNSPNGGTGGASQTTMDRPGYAGNVPGGGGSGGYNGDDYSGPSPGGGAGAYVSRTYSAGQLTVGASLAVTVGAGGNGGSCNGYQGGNGATGRVEFTWN